MAKLHDFEEHLMESIKDHHEAAYYLAACLDDAIAENDEEHFFQAVDKVTKATGLDLLGAFKLMHTHIAPADFPNVDENISIMLVKLRQRDQAQKRHLAEA